MPTRPPDCGVGESTRQGFNRRHGIKPRVEQEERKIYQKHQYSTNTLLPQLSLGIAAYERDRLSLGLAAYERDRLSLGDLYSLQAGPQPQRLISPQ